MTKKELLDKKFSIADFGERKDALYLSDLMEFLSSNVCIPKGANRHLDADVLHALAEDISLPAEYICNGNWEEYAVQLDRFRIKPSEPVYEWQWLYKAMSYDDWNLSKYMTDAEANLLSYKYKIKSEETKRERK